MKKNLSELEKKLHTTFTNQQLLKQALVHRSYLNENPSFELDHNERLEFLGDAVLELVVTDYLYNNFPNPEGELTNWRASLVNSNTLADTSTELGVEPFLYLSKGEARDKNTKARRYILANCYESLVGAIYLDQGYQAASDFIHRNLIPKLPNILSNELYIDAKSKFQEIAQDKLKVTPSYRVISEVGPDHNKIFTIGVYLGEELVAKSTGSSKQEAQTNAATAALTKKGWDSITKA